MYKIIGNPNAEIAIKKWNIISLNKANYIFEDRKKKKENFYIFDIAYQFGGMGWFKILSCDLTTGLLFYRNSEGSNDWDRKENEDKLMNYKKNEYNFITFDDWYENLDVNQKLF